MLYIKKKNALHFILYTLYFILYTLYFILYTYTLLTSIIVIAKDTTAPCLLGETSYKLRNMSQQRDSTYECKVAGTKYKV